MSGRNSGRPRLADVIDPLSPPFGSWSLRQEVEVRPSRDVGRFGRVHAVTEEQIRASFINCSKSEAKRLRTPDLAGVIWDDLDFLGWRDPRAPERAYLVAEVSGGLAGLELRASAALSGARFARGMCTICRTVRPRGATALLVARRAGASGRAGNTVGEYFCSDLACSLYVRGRKESADSLVTQETLSVEAKIERLQTSLEAFIQRVRG